MVMQTTKRPPAAESQSAAELAELEQELSPRTDSGRARPWWRRPWMIPLAVINVAFLVYIWGPYISLDPAKVRIMLVPSLPWHHALLMTHITGASIAMVAAFFQIWPRIRRRHRTIHR